jgi:hypothetical protein
VPVEVKLHGEVLPYRGLVIEPPPPASIKEFIDLAPGVVDSTEVQMLAADWDLQNLLGAEVTFVYANEQATTIAHPFNEDTRKYTEVAGLWTGTARSGTVTVDGAETGEKSAPKPLGAPEKGDLPTAALRLVQVTVQYSDSKGKDHRFALSEKELEAFSKLYPATPSYRSDQGVKCADAVGLRFKYSDATVVHAHFCGKPTQLHVFRAGSKSEMLTVNKDLHTLLLDAARRRGWQLDTLGNDTQSE